MIDYRQAGVNTEEGYRAVNKYKSQAARTHIPGVLNGLGSFAGMFAVPSDIKEPIMVSGTDGVGTKLDVAFALKKYDTVGIDCVAMCVNDILCHGATPLFFLDYLACGKLNADIASDLVKGVADGCVQSACALLGGETAEMPGFYADGIYDIAGFAVGVVEKSRIISGEAITEGDVLIGLESSGVHSNGFSLVRKLINDFNEPFPAAQKDNRIPSIGEVLLEPTRIYVKPILSLLKKTTVHGMVHITGGGFYENIPRMYSDSSLSSQIKRGSWNIPPIFTELITRGANPDRMFNTFNMGIGFILAVSPQDEKTVLSHFNTENDFGFKAHTIGSVVKNTQTEESQVLFV